MSGNQSKSGETQESLCSQGALAGADLYDEVRSWLELRCQSSAGDCAMRLYSRMRDRNPCWPLMGDRFRDALTERFDCVSTLSRTLQPAGDSPRPPRLAEWLDWAEQIAVPWLVPAARDWSLLILGLSEEDNRIAISCISQSLRASTYRILGLEGIDACAAELAGLDLDAWKGLPLPPAEGASLCPADYLFPVATGFSGDFEEVCERWEAMTDQMGDMQALASDPHSLRADAECYRICQEFRASLHLGRCGWPLNARQLADRAQVLATRLAKAVASLRETQFPAEGSVRSLLAEMDDLQGCLARCLASLPTPVTIETGGPLRDEAHPAVDTPIATGLEFLAKTLEGEDESAARDFVHRLREALTAGASSQSQSSSKRKALGCLIHLDELACRPTAASPWVRKAREYLCRLVLADGEIVILERELVGRPIEACVSLVEPVGHVEASGMPRRIVLVRQPGYAIRLPNGAQQVLRPAKVLLGK